jgi:RAT1-interacting protein
LCSLPRHNRATADIYSIKHPRWWVQSYLAGVPTLVLGCRDQQGNLIKVRGMVDGGGGGGGGG